MVTEGRAWAAWAYATQTCKKPLTGAFFDINGLPYCAEDAKALQDISTQ